MQYYPEGNWWGQYHQIEIYKTEIIFSSNSKGKKYNKIQVSTTAQNKTNTQVVFDQTLDFTYKYDSKNKRGEITYILDS